METTLNQKAYETIRRRFFRKLLCALRSHDAETASDLVQTQLETGRKAVLSFFDSNLSS